MKSLGYKSSSSTKKESEGSVGHSLGPSEVEELKQQHQFVRDDEFDQAHYDDWKVRMARKYYDQLYKEVAIIDLSRHEEAMIGLRWRTEAEVLRGKGQMTCAARKCEDNTSLTTFELPFTYQENGEEKIELVKVILCDGCSEKLHFYQTLQNRDNTDKAHGESDADNHTRERTSILRDVIGSQHGHERKKRKKHQDSSSSDTDSSSESRASSERESKSRKNSNKKSKKRDSKSSKKKKSSKEKKKSKA